MQKMKSHQNKINRLLTGYEMTPITLYRKMDNFLREFTEKQQLKQFDRQGCSKTDYVRKNKKN